MMFSQSILFCLWTNILSAHKDEKIVSARGILQSLATRNLQQHNGTLQQHNGSRCRTTGHQARVDASLAKPCVFPFIYNGVQWNSCTDVDDQSGIPWCSTSTNALNQHIRGNWGYCADNCPSKSQWGTSGGNKPNSQCIFPFIYANVVWNSCTTVDAGGDRAWCSTLVDNDNKHIKGNWGSCNSSTPTPAIQCLECGSDENANECQTGEIGILRQCDSTTSFCLVAKGLVKDRPEATFKKCVNKETAAAFHRTQKGSLVFSDNSILTFCATNGCNTNDLVTATGMLTKFGDEQIVVDVIPDCNDCPQGRGGPVGIGAVLAIGFSGAAVGALVVGGKIVTGVALAAVATKVVIKAGAQVAGHVASGVAHAINNKPSASVTISHGTHGHHHGTTIQISVWNQSHRCTRHAQLTRDHYWNLESCADLCKRYQAKCCEYVSHRNRCKVYTTNNSKPKKTHQNKWAMMMW